MSKVTQRASGRAGTESQAPMTPKSCPWGAADSASLTILLRSPLFGSEITLRETKRAAEVQGWGSGFSPVVEYTQPSPNTPCPAPYRSPMHPRRADRAGPLRRPPCLMPTPSPSRIRQGSMGQRLGSVQSEPEGWVHTPAPQRPYGTGKLSGPRFLTCRMGYIIEPLDVLLLNHSNIST